MFKKHPMLNRRCLIRTYSAGVHIGTIISIQEIEVHIKNCVRILRWYDDKMSISSLSRISPVKIDVDFCDESFLTNVVEIIPITDEVNLAYEQLKKVQQKIS